MLLRVLMCGKCKPVLLGGDVLLQLVLSPPQENKRIMGQEPDDKMLVPRCEEVGTSPRLKPQIAAEVIPIRVLFGHENLGTDINVCCR